MNSRWLLGLCALVGLAVIGALFGFGVFGGSSDNSLPPFPTTGVYAPISVETPLIAKGALKPDPDSMLRQGQDLQMTLSRTPGSHHYQVIVTNTSGIGVINAFRWYPPPGVGIVKVVSSSSGNCEISGTSGQGGNQVPVVSNPEITCVSVSLKPPTCTCRGDGGQVKVSFVATNDLTLPGIVRLDTATPVLKIIPSYVQSPDLPHCARGQLSTKTKPCT